MARLRPNRLVLHRTPGLSGPFVQPIGRGRAVHVPAQQEVIPLEAFRYNPASFAMVGVYTGTEPLITQHADVIYVEDYQGVYVARDEDEPLWEGARYVDGVAYATDPSGDLLDPLPVLKIQPEATNEQPWSNDLTNAVWTASNCTVAKDTDGLTGASNEGCTLTATGADATVIADALTASSGTHASKWWLRRKTGTGIIELTLDNGATWQDVTSQVTGDYTEIIIEQGALANPQIGIRIRTSGDVIEVGNAGCHFNKFAANVRNLGPIFTTTSRVTTEATTYTIPSDNHAENQGLYVLTLKMGDVLANQGYLDRMGVLWFNRSGSAGGRMLGIRYLS